MTLRISVIAAGIAAAVVASGCDSKLDRTTSSYESTMEANALAAEAAEEEVSKAASENVAKSEEETAKTEGHKDNKEHKATAKTVAKKDSHKESKKDAHNDAHKETKVTTVAHGDTHTKGAGKTTRKPASAGKSVYIVQVGAFRIKDNADKLHAKLKADGYPVLMRPMQHSKNGQLYLVRLEPTPNRQEAETMVEKLKAQNELTGQILVRPENE